MFGCLRFWVLLGWLSLSCALGAASEQQEQCVEGVLYSNDLSPPPTTTVTTTSTTGQLPFLPALDMFLPFPVYYINMAQSGKRRERIERTFSPLWDLQHFPAIDGVNKTLVEELMGSENYASLKPFLYDTVQKKRMSDFDTLSNAEVGCILSHLLAIRQAYLAGHEMVMIIEDDLSPLLMYVQVKISYSNGRLGFRLSCLPPPPQKFKLYIMTPLISLSSSSNISHDTFFWVATTRIPTYKITGLIGPLPFLIFFMRLKEKIGTPSNLVG